MGLNGKMFLGEYSHTIDDRGRLSLPRKMRTLIEGESVILAKGFEPCIFGYRKNEWETQTMDQLSAPVSDRGARDLRRYMFSGAELVEVDKLGRILLPQALKQYAGLRGNVSVIGAGDHFEIWDETQWRAYSKALEKQ